MMEPDDRYEALYRLCIEQAQNGSRVVIKENIDQNMLPTPSNAGYQRDLKASCLTLYIQRMQEAHEPTPYLREPSARPEMHKPHVANPRPHNSIKPRTISRTTRRCRTHNLTADDCCHLP
jgi:hypothetical protein